MSCPFGLKEIKGDMTCDVLIYHSDCWKKVEDCCNGPLVQQNIITVITRV